MTEFKQYILRNEEVLDRFNKTERSNLLKERIGFINYLINTYGARMVYQHLERIDLLKSYPDYLNLKAL